MANIRVTHFTHGSVVVSQDGRTLAEFIVIQQPDGTEVRRITGHGESVVVQMPQPRYALAVLAGVSLAGHPGRDAFDRDLLSIL